MATTEERMKILTMIREGKISAEEGASLSSLWVTAKSPPARSQPGLQVNHVGSGYG